MDATAKTIAELDRAELAFSRALGKHTLEEALELLLELKLETEAEELVYGRIERAFERDAFAGYLRYGGIVQVIQIEKIRLQHRTPKE